MYGIFIVILLIIVIISTFYYNYNVKRTERILDYIKNGDKILDFGSGSSCLKKKLNRLKNKNIEVISIDVKDFSKCDSPIIYDGKNIPLDDKSVDVSVCSFVLHHTSIHEHLLKELKRVSKRLVIIMEDIPQTSFDKILIESHLKCHWGHGSYKSKEEWIQLLSKYFIVNYIEIPRLEFPFAHRPLFYPIKRICFYCNIV